MKRKKYFPILFLIGLIIYLSAGPGIAQANQQGPIHREFSKKEIKKMQNTEAIIETKFGNITLRFFPDVAPNHVKNFIDWPKRDFMTARYSTG